MGKIIADIMFVTVRRLLLGLPDRRLALICRVAGRLVYAVTGNEFLKGVFDEVVDIFEAGPPGTEMLRKIFRESERPFAADLVQGLLGL